MLKVRFFSRYRFSPFSGAAEHLLQIYRMLCTTIYNLFKQHFVSWNGLLLNSTYKLQIPTEGRGPGGAGISHKNLWLVVPKSAISGHSSPPNAQIGASNPLFPDQDQAKICLSNPLSPGQGSAGASRGLISLSATAGNKSA